MTLSSRMIIVLTCVGLLSGGFLTGVGLVTKGRIAYNKKMEIEEAIAAVVPMTSSSETLHEEKDFTVYGGKDESGNLLGFAVYTSGMGFQDKITLMFGVNASLTKISRMTILEQLETPGLGAKIKDIESFLKYWEGKNSSQLLTLRKPAVSSVEELAASEVNTITGATISSQAVLDMVNLAMEKLRALESEGKLLGKGQDAK
jgi:RnfABCDGE-type electron transport complex G subunit